MRPPKPTPAPLLFKSQHPTLHQHATALATEITNRINRMVPFITLERGEADTPYRAQAILEEVIRQLQEKV